MSVLSRFSLLGEINRWVVLKSHKFYTTQLLETELVCFLSIEFIKNNIFPAALKRANDPPHFKRVDHGNPLYYLPVAHTQALSKHFESLVKQQIGEHDNKYKLPSKSHFCLNNRTVLYNTFFMLFAP